MPSRSLSDEAELDGMLDLATLYYMEHGWIPVDMAVQLDNHGILINQLIEAVDLAAWEELDEVIEEDDDGSGSSSFTH